MQGGGMYQHAVQQAEINKETVAHKLEAAKNAARRHAEEGARDLRRRCAPFQVCGGEFRGAGGGVQ